MRLRQHGALVGGEVDHAVGDDNVEGGVGEAARAQVLDLAVDKLGVRRREPELRRVPRRMLARHLDLRRCHVDAYDTAGLAHELGEQVDIAARAAAEVEDR